MTPKARAQDALEDYNASRAADYTKPETVEAIRESLALSEALERVPKGWRQELTHNMEMINPWRFTIGALINSKHYAGFGDTPAAAILAALEALEKHAAAVKRGEE